MPTSRLADGREVALDDLKNAETLRIDLPPVNLAIDYDRDG